MQKVPEPNPAVHCEGYSVESYAIFQLMGKLTVPSNKTKLKKVALN